MPGATGAGPAPVGAELCADGHKTQARVNYNESSEVYALYADVYGQKPSEAPSV